MYRDLTYSAYKREIDLDVMKVYLQLSLVNFLPSSLSVFIKGIPFINSTIDVDLAKALPQGAV